MHGHGGCFELAGGSGIALAGKGISCQLYLLRVQMHARAY